MDLFIFLLLYSLINACNPYFLIIFKIETGEIVEFKYFFNETFNTAEIVNENWTINGAIPATTCGTLSVVG